MVGDQVTLTKIILCLGFADSFIVSMKQPDDSLRYL